MSEQIHHRVAFGAVAVGVLVGAGLAIIPLLLGAALYVSLTSAGLQPAPVLAAAWFMGTYVMAAYLGGRFAAVSGMAVTAREGALHGLVTWCVWTLTAAAAAAVAVGSGWVARPEIANAAQVPDVEVAYWWLVAAYALALLASLAGGLRGARAEARILGGWSRSTPESVLPFDPPAPAGIDVEQYYAEEPLVIRAAGVPTGI